MMVEFINELVVLLACIKLVIVKFEILNKLLHVKLDLGLCTVSGLRVSKTGLI